MTETKMQLVDWLDDLCVRFIVNLPKEELESVERICFQVEEAQWFYEDFVRPLDPNLPSMNLRQFCLRIFQHCPLLSGFTPYHHSAAFSEFLAYKTRVPVRGAIMLNQAMDEVVLVKGWKKNANWSFPRGKINKDEKDIDCAIREVYEETGYDVRTAGLAADESTKYIEITMREQHMRLYIFRGVPTDTYFEPRTRKEISKIQWYKLSELPTLKKKHQQEARGEDIVNASKFYMVAPFLVPLKKWILQQKKQDAVNGPKHLLAGAGQSSAEEPVAIPQPEPDQDNMSRLLLQLRQSGQASRESNLPEVLRTTQAKSSIQLKNLLSVPGKATKADPEPPIPSTIKSKVKASAMLSILRSGPQGHVQPYSEPQTPLEQIIMQPEMPAPPKAHAQHPEAVPNLPQFPFFPAQSISHDYGRTIQALPKPQEPRSRSQLGHSKSQSSNINLEQQDRLPVGQKGPSALAPYQRTGDPQFSQVKPSASLQPSIPPANRLPPPKLNSHSSALLQLFKSEALATADSRPESELPASATPLSLPLNPKPLLPHGLPSFSTAIRPALASPLFEGPRQDTSKPRLPQQKALLDLFKLPASRMVSEIPTATAPTASAPVELAAHPSSTHRISAHPRIGSQALQPSALVATMASSPQPPVNGKVIIQRRPDSFSGSKKPAVSATVTGPLHVPQFERILKRAPGISENGALESKSPNSVPSTQAIPVKILPRPATVTIAAGKAPGPHPSREARNKPKASASRKMTTESKPSPKPFQPQILKRTPEPPATLQSEENVQHLDTHRLSPTFAEETAILGRRASQTNEQKMALLSLFSKPTVLDQLQASSRETPVSPISDVYSSTTSQPKNMAPARRTISASSVIDDNNLHPTKMNNTISASTDLSSFHLLPGHSIAPATTATAAADLDLTPKARTASTFPLIVDHSTHRRQQGQQPLGAMTTPALTAPTSLRPSRQSSLVSMPSDDASLAGRRTPRMAEGDKQFLLGFLDGATKGLR